jgi:hypothetical protein
MAINFENQDAADKAFRANLSPRYCQLENFEKWAEGRQYDSKQGWFDESGGVPLWERAPAVVYPVVDIAANSFVDLLLGEGRFPKFTTKLSEDESDEDNGLSPEQSADVDRFIRETHRLCRFRAYSRDASYSGMICGSTAAIHGVRAGKPFVDLVPAKWCEPELGQEGEVLKLEVRYPYQEQFKDRSGKWAVRAKLYRRVIDDKRDVEYLPGDAAESGIEPDWKENKARSVDHGLGFCPVIWYPFMRGCVPVNELDGKPIHRHITDEIHQHDIARSQWHRGALMSEPQIVETGVTPGYSPTDIGRKPDIYASVDGKAKFSSQEELDRLKSKGVITGSYGSSGQPAKARKKGPGWVWQYANPETKVFVLTYPGEALKAQEDNCRDLRLKLQESLCVIFLDPESIKFAATTSGKALQAIKQKQIDRCGQIRDDLEQRLFEPSVSMQLRIAQRVMASGQKLKTPGAKKVKPILDMMLQGGEWSAPTIYTLWGDYYAPDPAEQEIIVRMVLSALEAGVPMLTVKAAVQKLAPIFGIENVSAFVDELETERERRSKDAMLKAQQELKAAHDLASAGDDDSEDDDEELGAARAGRGSEREEAPGGRSGGAFAVNAKA